LFTNECAKNIYIHPWCEEAVYRAPIQNIQTTDRRTQQCSNSATVLSTVG